MLGSESLNSFTIYAQPTASGFFGLSELQLFTTRDVEPYINVKDKPSIIMDFSSVRVWDIAALLWLTVALHHYRRKEGLKYLLRLPQGNDDMDVKERDAFNRSADYLRRWRFDRGLQHIDAGIANLLVPEQRNFFNPPEPNRFFLPKKVSDESGLLQSLISRKLAEIRGLSDPSFTGSAPISPDQITKCIREFQAERIGDILSVQCGIDKRKADLFSDHLLTEALLNIQEHPDATIGMVAISLMGNTNELILSVVDNGKSIPDTIYPRFLTDKSEEQRTAYSTTYNRDEFTIEQRAEIANHATKPGVTRKKYSLPGGGGMGMGLTYIKEDSVSTFNGTLTVVTDHMRLTYKNDPNAPPEHQEWHHSWYGNLLRIAIPIQSNSNMREQPKSYAT